MIGSVDLRIDRIYRIYLIFINQFYPLSGVARLEFVAKSKEYCSHLRKINLFFNKN